MGRIFYIGAIRVYEKLQVQKLTQLERNRGQTVRTCLKSFWKPLLKLAFSDFDYFGYNPYQIRLLENFANRFLGIDFAVEVQPKISCLFPQEGSAGHLSSQASIEAWGSGGRQRKD